MQNYELLENLDIDLKNKRSGTIKTTCPKCSPQRKNKKDTCLSVNIDEGLYRCHHCEWHGKVFNKIQKKEYTIPVPRLEKLEKTTIEWFENVRKISNNTLLRFGVTDSREWMPKNGTEVPVICFNYYRDGKLVNTKFRAKGKDFKLIKGAELIFYNLDSIKGEKIAYVVEGECFHPSAQVLTENGWVSFSDYNNQKVAQYLPDGSIEFVYPLAKIEKNFDGELIEISNKNRFYSLTTPEHDLVFKNKNYLIKRKANNLPSGNLSIPRVSSHNGIGINLTDDEIRLCIAISADFTFRKHGDIYGAFKKERKAERLKEIFTKTKVKYSLNFDSRGYYSFFIRRGDAPKYLFKLFPMDWISLSTQDQKRLIINEILYWDGNSVPNRNQIEYSSKEYHNATFIQTISSLCGYCSTIMNRKNKFGTWYKVSILFGKQYTSSQGLKDKIRKIPYNGLVNCLKVSSGMLLVRQDNCISVSGNCDALSLHEAGVYNVVSVPNGASKGNQKMEYLDNCWELFEDKEKIILFTDNDEAGYSLREELGRRLGFERCYKVNYPEGCKDANEILIKYGAETLKKICENIEPFPIEGVLSVGEDLIDDIYHFWEHGYPSGVKTGIENLDEYFSLMEGQYTTFTGIPSSGKSEIIDYITTSVSKTHGWKWGITSFENQPSSLHTTKLIEKIGGAAFGFRKDPANRLTQSQFEHSLLFAHEHFTFVNVNKVDLSLDGILQKFAELVKQRGCKGFVLDPWNYIESAIPPGMTETQYISECLTKIKAFCMKYAAHLFLVAHPTKLKKEANGKYEIPTMYSISGSAHFFNKTDNGIAVYRDYETGVVTLYIQKIRYSWLGKLGSCEFMFNSETRQYIPINFSSSNNNLNNQQLHQSTVDYNLANQEEMPF